MNVQEFVATTLKEIIAGVREAQENAKHHKAEICPQLQHRSHASDGAHTTVEFDLAVTTEAQTGSTIGGGINVIPFSAAAKTDGRATESNATRIRFSLVVRLPEQV